MARKKLEQCIYDMGAGRDGRYLVRVKLSQDKDATQTFDSIRSARAWRDAQRADRSRGTAVDPGAGKITFQAYAEKWLENKATKAHNTKRLVERALAIHAFPHIGSRPMSSIRRSDVQGLVNRMNQTLEPVTVRNYHGHISSVFSSAVLDGIIADTPCNRIELPENRKGRRSIVPILPEQVARIAAHMDAEWRAAVWFAADTGLRPGELFAVTVESADFLRRVVTVDRQVQTGPGGVYLCPLKTQASERTVPLAASTIARVSRLLEKYPPVTLTLPDGPPPAKGTPDLRPRVEATFLFGQRMFTRDAMTRAWTRATAQIEGLPDRSGWHALRHYYASMLIAGGESVKVVQARLGHKSATETLDTYGHLWPDNEDTTRAIVDAASGPLDVGDLVPLRSPNVP